MARARNIKPSIMDNEDLAELEPITRLLFIYLWMLADREGRLEDRPKRIAAQALAYDRDADANEMLESLAKSGFITRYVVDGIACIQINSFTKHQTPHVREAASSLPCIGQSTTKAVPSTNLGDGETSPRSPDSLIPDSLIPDSIEVPSVLVASKLPTCPQSEIIALFAEELPTLPQPRVWDGVREKNLRSRWRWVISDLKAKGKPASDADGLDFFRRMFGYIRKSDFLMGRSNDWSCPGLHWVVEAGNFAKIIEGAYENKVAA